MNSACMIELKKEYTILLCHVLSPIILEGLQSIYDRAKNGCQKNNVLKTFQLFLKAIPSWDIEIVRKEVERIISKTKEQSWLINLIQTIFKLTILINNLKPSEILKTELDMGHFIHSIYIECARQFWMDPFLFYHECSSLEQKKNYNEILKTICCCIENAIRRALPLSVIFDKLLGKDNIIDFTTLNLSEMYKVQLILDNTPMTGGGDKPNEEEKPNMLGGNNEDIKNEFNIIPTNQGMPNMPSMQNNMQGMQNNMQMPPMPNNMPMQNNMQGIPMMQNMQMVGGNDNNINDKILNIINKNNILSDSNEDNNNNFTVNNHSANNFPNNVPQMMQPMQTQPMQMQPIIMMPQMMGGNMMNNQMPQNKHHSDRKSSSTLKRIINESIKNSHHSATKSNGSNNSELKNKILKDLDSDTISYNPEDNAKNYQDIFSNSDVKHTVNTHDKVEKKSREKFFNNYLNI
jgi:hypothetical protein